MTKAIAQKIDELIAFLPGFEVPGREFVKDWVTPGGDPNVPVMQYPVYCDDVAKFYKLASQEFWQVQYDPQVAKEMVRDQAGIGSADLPATKTMMTYCVRGEHFGEGHWAAMLEDGSVLALLRRLKELRKQAPSAEETLPAAAVAAHPKAKSLAGNSGMLTLKANHWYAWQMLPGYTGVPYFSPIYVREVTPLKSGKGILKVEFYNAGYAEGVQDFTVQIRVLKRTPDYLFGELTGEPKGRSCVVSLVTAEWLGKFCPDFWRQHADDFAAGNDTGTVLSRILGYSR